MTIATVRAAIATVQRSITGINKAYDQLPRGMINGSDLPLFMTFVRKGTFDKDILGSDTIQITRLYLMWLMVKPVAEGEEGEGEALVEPWIDTVIPYFYARPQLGHASTVLDSMIIEDSGPKKMVWPGTPTNPLGVYWGAEFQLSVTEETIRTYSNNE